MSDPRMSPEAKAKLNSHNERCDDWRGVCVYCGEEIEGTLAELKAHSCSEMAADKVKMN
jgi:hypothetical protein